MSSRQSERVGLGQSEIDRQNAAFWSELCGSALARSLGITGDEPDALERFDADYLGFYPYLQGYVDRFDLAGRDVLEIGLGYGTLGQYIAERGAVYHGLDIAPTPVEMMRHRLRMLGRRRRARRPGLGARDPVAGRDASTPSSRSAACTTPATSTRRSRRCTASCSRAGTAVVMLYNRHSARQPSGSAVRADRTADASESGGAYDPNAEGEPRSAHGLHLAPRVREVCSPTSRASRSRPENFDDLTSAADARLRDRALRTPLPRLLGLDLYIIAKK